MKVTKGLCALAEPVVPVHLCLAAQAFYDVSAGRSAASGRACTKGPHGASTTTRQPQAQGAPCAESLRRLSAIVVSRGATSSGSVALAASGVTGRVDGIAI